jgi:hypothetical protein
MDRYVPSAALTGLAPSETSSQRSTVAPKGFTARSSIARCRRTTRGDGRLPGSGRQANTCCIPATRWLGTSTESSKFWPSRESNSSPAPTGMHSSNDPFVAEDSRRLAHGWRWSRAPSWTFWAGWVGTRGRAPDPHPLERIGACSSWPDGRRMRFIITASTWIG